MLSCQTKYFGALPYEPSAVIEFPEGIPAFEDQRKFILIDREDLKPLVFMQSLETPGLCFLTVPAGPGIRDDSGVTQGDEVSIYYDPLISKLAAWGRSREESIDRLRRALDEYAVGGIKTTLPFFREILRDEEFIAGHLDTGFISRFQERTRKSRHLAGGPQASSLLRDTAIIAAALAYVRDQREITGDHQPREQSKWKMAGRTAGLNREPKRKFPGAPLGE